MAQIKVRLKSPRPIKRRIVVKLGIWRVPEGPIVPRLKPEPTDERTRAIGFRADISGDKNE
jgi:hypothetical protein